MHDVEEGCALVPLWGLHFGAVGPVLASGDHALPPQATSSRGASSRSRSVDHRPLISHELIAQIGSTVWCTVAGVTSAHADARALEIWIQKVVVSSAAGSAGTGHTVVVAWRVVARWWASWTTWAISGAKLLAVITLAAHWHALRRHGSSSADRSQR